MIINPNVNAEGREYITVTEDIKNTMADCIDWFVNNIDDFDTVTDIRLVDISASSESSNALVYACVEYYSYDSDTYMGLRLNSRMTADKRCLRTAATSATTSCRLYENSVYEIIRKAVQNDI